jgi:hypothetical protein
LLLTIPVVVAAIVSVTSAEDSMAAVDVMLFMLGIVNFSNGSTAPPKDIQMLNSSESSLGTVSISIVYQGVMHFNPASSSPILCAVRITTALPTRGAQPMTDPSRDRKRQLRMSRSHRYWQVER